jgi:lipopolysaccharide export system permease protein
VTRLERSIALEVIPNFFIGTAMYVAVFLVQRVIAQPFLSALPASSFAPWLLYQIPAFAIQAFPIAAVFAVLLAFGRLARENELIAAAAGGISLLRAVRPVLAFGVLLAVAGFLIAEFLAPRANELVANTWWRGVSQSGNALERVVGKPLLVGDRVLYIGGLERGELRDVRLEWWTGNTLNVFFGKQARFTENNVQLIGYRSFSVNLDQFPARPEDPNWLFDAFPSSVIPLNPNAKTTIALPKTADRVLAENADSGFEDSRRLSELWREYNDEGKTEAGSQLGFKTAQPLASLVILLFGIPIAARGARSSGVAFGLAVVIAVGFYVALYLGRTLSQVGILPPLVGPWLVNIGFLVAGLMLFRSRSM